MSDLTPTEDRCQGVLVGLRQPRGVTGMLSPGSFGHGGAFGTRAWADPKRGVFMILLIQRSGLRNSDASDMRREFQHLAADAVKP